VEFTIEKLDGEWIRSQIVNRPAHYAGERVISKWIDMKRRFITMSSKFYNLRQLTSGAFTTRFAC